ncbi:MAG: hypothetical protein C5B50_02130 [Verrucomicrobia bacterium]|nr:MAG: hypothetical protein C5B50_02130 [Verrucomicrobiota bacterium]
MRIMNLSLSMANERNSLGNVLVSRNPSMIRSLALILIVVTVEWPSLGQRTDDPQKFYPERLIAPLPVGALGRPFGESVVVQGKIAT